MFTKPEVKNISLELLCYAVSIANARTVNVGKSITKKFWDMLILIVLKGHGKMKWLNTF